MYEIKYRDKSEFIKIDEETFSVRPRDWETVGLNKLFFIKAGGDLKSQYFSEIPTSIYQYPIYTNNTSRDNVYGYTSKPFFKGDSITVTGRGDIGYACYRPLDFDAIIRLLVLTPKKKLSCKYFTYFINGKLNFNVGSSAINQLSAQQIAPYKVFLPTLIEQQKIADFLDIKTAQFDNIISKKEQLIKKLEEAKKSLISEVVTGKVKIVGEELVKRETSEMKDSGVDWIGKIPEEWQVKKLGYVSNMIVPMRDKPTSFDGDIPWIRIEDFSGKYIEESKSKQNVSKRLIRSMNHKIYPKGTVLCTCSCNLGTAAITKKELISNQTFIGIVPNKKIKSEYVYYLMQSNAKRLQFLSDGAIQQYLSREKFEHLIIQLPTIDEQKEIIDYLNIKVDQIDNLIKKKKLLLSKLGHAKQSLIFEAVTGKIDLRDWEIIEEGEML